MEKEEIIGEINQSLKYLESNNYYSAEDCLLSAIKGIKEFENEEEWEE